MAKDLFKSILITFNPAREYLFSSLVRIDQLRLPGFGSEDYVF